MPVYFVEYYRYTFNNLPSQTTFYFRSNCATRLGISPITAIGNITTAPSISFPFLYTENTNHIVQEYVVMERAMWDSRTVLLVS